MSYKFLLIYPTKMSNNYNINFDYNKFFRDIKLKKQYIEKLNKKIAFLNEIKKKNYKTLNASMFTKNKDYVKNDFTLTYIIDIHFSQTNTLLHVTDFSGKPKFFRSAGSFHYKGKSKKARFAVFKEFYRILVTKLKFLKGKPLALHLKNAGSNKFWIIKKLKKKFFIKVVRVFNVYPHNGCRKKKVRRKKF